MNDRDVALNTVLVEFAANLCGDFSVQSILEHLVASTVELLPVGGAGVMVVDAGDDLHFVAATDEVVRTIEVLQRETGEGPCLRAHRSGLRCALDDLSAEQDLPEFSRRALEAGMAAVFSFPLRAAGLALGALDLYRSTPGPLSAEDVRVASVLADVAAAYLVNARSRADSSLLLADLNHRSLHDELTGLPNRTLLTELLTEALQRAVRSRRRIAVLFIDLDEFKAVNDRWGHQAGDQLLNAVSARLTAALRPGDALARLGGDEFVAVCEDLAEEGAAVDVAQRLLDAMTAPFHLGGRDLELGASIGIALSDPRHPTDAQRLLATADAAMYDAKGAGGRRHHVRHHLRRVTRDDRLPTAPRPVLGPTVPRRPRSTVDSLLRSGGVRAVFQPVVDLDSSVVVAHEALARGPAGDLADPLSLFASARREGLLAELDDACRREAVRSATAQQRSRTTLFLNAEPEAFAASPAASPWASLRELVDSADVDLDVVLEITERDIPTRPATLLRTVDRVRELGWRIALDDVGISSASLAFMPLLRPDVVKLDASLVQRRPSRETAQIVHAVNDYAERTGALVLAEGIENHQHLHTARGFGARLGQGWLFGRPSERLATAAVAAAPGDLQDLFTRPSPVARDPRPLAEVSTPFGVLPSGVPLRRASKALLMQLSNQLEEQAARSGQTCVLTSAFQHARHFTPTTARRYARVADQAGFVYAVGEAFDGVDVPGVHVASVPADDALCREWDVTIIGPHFHAALLARDVGDDVPDRERVFDYAVTYRYDTVVAATRDLLLRVTEGGSPNVPGLEPRSTRTVQDRADGIRRTAVGREGGEHRG